ncbi:hypothetical protein AMAG_18733 [Allomyces macrogynus ATCC 38327]|uniref:Uncharacterized protein n=1 Tax=Allomyces macrogynus (strain ATCC 38327) TaxID=578462 RepID=A0A0L0SET7_ALLM3|nr:hypothetical protein AMAG_18733 [Allomyces macrogynus ATCC 38327]|eukprot:KNE61043.1 hypothetical protein AMAG_18733 [Allomyces macrogynus ATCC 38327]
MTVFVMGSNSVLDKDEEAVNGLGQPSVLALIPLRPFELVVSLSLYNVHEPFDYRLSFVVISIFSLTTFALTFWLDPAINGPRDVAEEGWSKRVAAASPAESSHRSSSNADTSTRPCPREPKIKVTESKGSEA